MTLTPIRMPKWGLSMQEGTIVNWWKEEGAPVAEGDELVDIETSKITNVFEAPQAGTLRRIVAKQGETLPVGALIGVVAEAGDSDSDIDAFVSDFQANFTPGDVEGESGGALAVSNVEAGGRTIRVGRAGEGEGVPVVLLHGFSGDMNNWLFNIEALATVAPVIAIDLPGHGGSSKDVGDASLVTLSKAVADTLDALGVRNAHIIGHSLGGAVAARFAIDNPARVASLTVIAPALFPGTRASEEFLTGIVEAQRARDLKPFVEMLFADPSLVTKDMLEDMTKYKRLDGVEEALAALRDRLVNADDAAGLASGLAKIPSGTVIASKSDQIVGAPDQAALPPSFRVIWIDAGHMPHLEKAAEVNAILKEAIG
ncbi:MAG TPA: acetoin dehydrogenase dihydrolipoyllysine-residue acetyltransferase subunit [Rhizomicrobium sp.]|nr:acetoin dehydrogenase dihydrolipoyllysine-residue acetyltransferase subunit [Rhizomicrobium sp.]